MQIEFVAEDGDEAERIITEVDKIKAGAGNRYAAPDQSPPLIT